MSKLSTRCGPTKKRSFRTQGAAMRRGVQLEPKLGPTRTYWCQFCGGWHLTSRGTA